jgi:hypothetical protein
MKRNVTTQYFLYTIINGAKFPEGSTLFDKLIRLMVLLQLDPARYELHVHMQSTRLSNHAPNPTS